MHEHAMSPVQRLAREIRAWHVIIGAIIFFGSSGAGLGATLLTFGENRLRVAAADAAVAAVDPVANAIENRLATIEAAVANSVTREELAEKLDNERRWREQILANVQELREEIRTWHQAERRGNGG